MTAILASVIAAAVHSSPSPAQEAGKPAGQVAPVELNFGFPWNGGVGFPPALTDATGYAIHLGLAGPILEAHGFKLGRQIGFNTGPLALAGLQSGEIQLAQTGETPAVLTVVNGQATRAVTIGAPAGDLWIVARKSEAGKLEDLAGKSIGAAFGSNFDKFALAALKRTGQQDKVKLVNLSPSETYPALQSGGVAAVVASPPQAVGWRRKDKDVHIIARAREGDPTLELSASVVVTTEDFAARNPGLQKALWEVQKAGIAEIRKDPQKYYTFYSQKTGLSPEESSTVVLLNFADAPIAPDGLKVIRSSLAFLTDTGVIKRSADVDAWALK
ncbi:ABC transporter substrate-binding protein [Pseudochelatococcus lubricantis]|uniref:ABC transporter substrate-binding protein n=1 Tax=Pseudochelatococcus lubricantis TaxID=1538102 RepID=UPI0035E9CB2A